MLLVWCVQLGLLNVTLDTDRYILSVCTSICICLAQLCGLIYHMFSFINSILLPLCNSLNSDMIGLLIKFCKRDTTVCLMDGMGSLTRLYFTF